MSDYKTKDGKEITFDLYTFTNAEYMQIFGEGDDVLNKLVAKAAGITVEELNALPYPDNRKIVALFFEKCRDVTKDPNSASVSTSV